MGCSVICNQEYKKERYFNNREKRTQIEITKIETDIELLEKEVNDLHMEMNEINGGTNNGKYCGNKKEKTKNLFKKIKKLEELKLIKNKLENNLEKMQSLKLHKEYNGEISANNKLFENNKIDGKEIEKNNELLYQINNQSELLNQKLQEGENMLEDGMNEFEMEQKIKEHFNSYNN